jgi:AraC-like DNA-binding protein
VPDIVHTTKPLHFRDKLSYWHDVACKAFVEHNIRPENRHSFEAHIRATSLDLLKLSVCGNSAMTVMRNERQAARASSDGVFAYIQTSGTAIVSQDGRDVVVAEGGLTLIDTQRPYMFKFSEGSEQVVGQFSRREIEARVGDISQQTAYRLDSNNGAGRLAADFLRLLAAHVDDIPDFSRAQLGNQAVDLLALALSAGGARKKDLSSARMTSLLRLKSVIESRLSDSELTCAEIAGAAGVSVRYANQLLASESTSVQRYLFERRLEKCRQALVDARQDAKTITDIAYAWGFSDMSHFGRIFKARHGLTPRDYRAQSRTAH